MPNDATRPNHRLGLAAVLALGAGLRLLLLGDKGFWIDEIIRFTWAKGYELTRFFDVRPSEIGPALPAGDLGQTFQLARIHNPPLNALLMNLWIRTAGAETDFAVRLPIAIVGALAVLGVYLWAREAFDGRVALLGALLTAASPQLVHLAQEANHYALPLCLQAFATWFFFRMLRTHAWVDMAAFSFLSFLAIFAHYFCVIILFVQGLAFLYCVRRTPRRAVVASWTVLAPAALLAVYLVVNHRQLQEMTDPAIMGSHPVWSFFLQSTKTNLVQPLVGEWSPAFGGVLLVALLAFAIRGGGGSQPDVRRAALITALVPYGITVAAFWIFRKNSILWPRYHSFFAPALLVMVAAGVLSFRRRIVAGAVALGLSIPLVLGLHHYYSRFRMEDWRGAARVVDLRSTAADNVIIVPVNTTYAIARYLKHDLRMFGADAEPGYYGKLLKTAVEAPAVWTVFGWDDTSPLARRLRADLSCRYPLREDYVLDRMFVSRYHTAPALDSGTLENTCAERR